MKRKHSRRIKDLLERADHGETTELRLRYKDGGVGETSVDEPGILEFFRELVDDLQQGRELSEEGRDFLKDLLLGYELGPAVGGCLPNKQARAANAQALIGPVCEYRRLRKDGDSADIAAAKVKRQYPQSFADKERDTVKEILQHPNRFAGVK
ncbi:MAG: hypothetical protein ACRECV_02720 [Xanthobacteraceae bacterium]